MNRIDPVLKRWPLAAFVVSAAMLAVAHGFQTFGHLAPCHLCLKERQVYWVALGVAAAAWALALSPLPGPWRRLGSLLLAGVFAYGTWLAGFHAGAEWKWWPAPETCSSTGPVSLAQMQALLAGHGRRAPACDVAPWRFLGLSMAGWNCVVSAGLTLLSLAATFTGEKKAR